MEIGLNWTGSASNGMTIFTNCFEQRSSKFEQRGFMLRTILKSKIHRLTVTEANLHYAGSITLDKDLMKVADILNHEKVHVVDVTNGARLETYAIEGEAGSGVVCINGAAAHLVDKGNTIIVISYAHMESGKAAIYHPTVVHVDSDNKVIDAVDYDDEKDEC